MKSSLADQRRGARISIIECLHPGAIRLRLAEMGIRPGGEASVRERAAGGALVLDLDGTSVAVDRATARGIRVETA